MSIEQHELYYRPKYIKIYEIVHPNTYKKYEKQGKLEILWWIFDPKLLWTIDQLREMYGPITINNWYVPLDNGKYTINDSGFKERGLRDLNTTTGSQLSQHKFGRAIDCSFNTISAPEIVKSIEDAGMFKDGAWRNSTEYRLYHMFRYITCIERSVNGKPISWLHIDTGNRPIKNNGAIIVLDL